MPLEVFISYAHRDRRFRNELAAHLSSLRNQQLIHDWFDGDILPGTEWKQDIFEHLHSAHIILLLISANFMDSEFCSSIEMTQAITRHDANQARVIPIILRPTDWKGTSFEKLAMLPTNGKPITHWPTHDDAFEDVVRGIRKVIEDWNSNLPTTTLLNPAHSESCHSQQEQLWTIPYRRNPFFTGRELLLKRLHTILHTEQAAALSQPPAISGLGGIGKTQLAVEYAYRFRQEYHYVFWVQANTHETLLSSFVTLATLLNLTEKNAPDQQITTQAVKAWLETHNGWLLIFDNADDLTLIDPFLPSNYVGQILLTTRSHIMRGRAQRLDIDKMPTEEAVRFLLRRIGLLALDATLQSIAPATFTIATDLVKALGGLPLALDQAGAYIEETECDLSNYLELYRNRRRELHQRRSNRTIDHPEPVATTWSLSFQSVEQTNPTAAELLRFCAFLHPDAIPIEFLSQGAQFVSAEFEKIASDPIKLDEAIGELLNYSLIQRLSETNALAIHRLVQAVLIDEMDFPIQRHWGERIIRAVNALFPFNVTDWHLCQRYLTHAMLCVSYIQQWNILEDPSLDSPIHFDAERLLDNLASYLYARAQYSDAEPLAERGLAIMEQALGPNHPTTAQNLNYLANLYFRKGKYKQAALFYWQALTIMEQVAGANHPNTAQSLNNLANLYYSQGKYEQAEPLYQRALAIMEQTLGPNHPKTIMVFVNYVNHPQRIKADQMQITKSD